MCLAVPHRIVEIRDNSQALARTGAVEVEVRTDLLENIEVGDVVLVHAGFAIEKLQEDDGKELEQLWEEVRRFAESGNA